jgi:acetyl esterase/lipase
MATYEIEIREKVVYLKRGETALWGDVYMPLGKGRFPAVVAIHGGGWRLATTDTYRYFAPWLAAQGYVVFTPTYTMAKKNEPSYPAAIEDIRAAIQFLRGRAAEFRVDPARVAAMGESAGGYLAAMVGLAGDEPRFQAKIGAFPEESAAISAAIPIYGMFDLPAQWRWDQLVRAGEHITEPYLGKSLLVDRKIYLEASPLTYVVTKPGQPAFLVAWGATDDVVDPLTQSVPFFEALKMAKIYARTCRLADAPHYWMAEPLDDAGSYPAFFSTRLLRFLEAKL